MSKQTEAKEKQGYVPELVLPVCSNCINFKSDMVTTKAEYSWGNDFTQEKNPRCGIGGFAVKKRGSCNLFLFKPDAK